MDVDNFFGNKSALKAVQLNDHLDNSGDFTLRDTGISDKTIMNWDKHELLTNRREEKRQWRKFNFIDFLWLKFIHEFRQLGTPLNKIKHVKDELLTEIDGEQILDIFRANPSLLDNISDISEKEEITALLDKVGVKTQSISLFQLLVCEICITKEPMSVILFHDGDVSLWMDAHPEDHIYEEIRKKTFESHISVSIAGVIKKFLLSEKSNFVLSKILQPNEAKLLEMVQSGEYESITIHFKDQKMRSLEMVKSQDVKKRIVDVIQENKYQNISIKTHRGMVTKIENTIKMNL